MNNDEFSIVYTEYLTSIITNLNDSNKSLNCIDYNTYIAENMSFSNLEDIFKDIEREKIYTKRKNIIQKLLDKPNE